MAKRIPYDVWIDRTDGSSEKILTFYSDTQGLSDAAATTAAVAVLQDIIDKLNTPSPDSVSTNQGLVSPVQYHIRQWRSQERLEE